MRKKKRPNSTCIQKTNEVVQSGRVGYGILFKKKTKLYFQIREEVLGISLGILVYVYVYMDGTPRGDVIYTDANNHVSLTTHSPPSFSQILARGFLHKTVGLI